MRAHVLLHLAASLLLRRNTSYKCVYYNFAFNYRFQGWFWPVLVHWVCWLSHHLERSIVWLKNELMNLKKQIISSRPYLLTNWQSSESGTCPTFPQFISIRLPACPHGHRGRGCGQRDRQRLYAQCSCFAHECIVLWSNHEFDWIWIEIKKQYIRTQNMKNFWKNCMIYATYVYRLQTQNRKASTSQTKRGKHDGFTYSLL